MNIFSGIAMYLDNNFIKSVLPQAEIVQGSLKENPKFSVDSRTLNDGDIFIALKGAASDGHNFLKDALNRGASGLIIERSRQDLLLEVKHLLKNKFVLVVDDVLGAMVKLATEWRKKYDIPFIGITGSVGKTSTKEILSKILSTAGKKVYSTQKNQNTLIGITINILQMHEAYDVAVFEMGISKRGEMSQLADLVRPAFGVITVIGHAHMAGLGVLADIANEKRQIFKNFSERNIGVVNGDQPLLSTISYNHPTLKFGLKTTNQIQARKISVSESSIQFVLKIYNKKYSIRLATNNEGYVNNILASTAVAVLLGVDDSIIVKAVQEPVFITGRFDVKAIKDSDSKIIDDCYNANPESVKSALLAFEKISCIGNKIAVIGDMNELGAESSFWHRQIGRFLRKAPSINHLILVGNHVKYTSKTIPVYLKFDLVETWQEGLEVLSQILKKENNDLVLVKGSTSGYKNGVVNIVKELVVSDIREPISQDFSLIAAVKDRQPRVKSK